VNQDILKTVSAASLFFRIVQATPLLRTLSNLLKQREKCIKAASALVEQGTSVVVGMYIRNPFVTPNHTPHEVYADHDTYRQHKPRSRDASSLGQTSAETECTAAVRSLYGVGATMRTQRHRSSLESWTGSKYPIPCNTRRGTRVDTPPLNGSL
jgi:hypothetical protein